MPQVQFGNYSQTTLAAPLSNAATSVTVNSPAPFPSVGSGPYFWATLVDAASINANVNPPAQREIVQVTALTGNTYTIVRAQDGTTGQTWNAGDYFQIRANAQALYDAAASANGMSVGITIDGAGSVITTGVKGYIFVPFVGKIKSWYVVADQAGSIVIDVWKAAGTVPTGANTIAGSQLPTLTAAQIANNINLTTWTTAVAVGDVFGFNVNSVSTVKRVTLTIRVDV